MIKYLFTNSELIGSKLISGATKHDFQSTKDTPSHFCIVLADRWCLHSNFASGVHIEPYYFFKKKNAVVASLRKVNCPMSHIDCQLLFDQLVKKAWGHKYDFLAVLYFTWRIALKWLFGFKIPDKNKWEVQERWFCNELFELILKQDLSMKTPNDLMWLLLEHDDFDSCEVYQ